MWLLRLHQCWLQCSEFRHFVYSRHNKGLNLAHLTDLYDSLMVIWVGLMWSFKMPVYIHFKNSLPIAVRYKALLVFISVIQVFHYGLTGSLMDFSHVTCSHESFWGMHMVFIFFSLLVTVVLQAIISWQLLWHPLLSLKCVISLI